MATLNFPDPAITNPYIAPNGNIYNHDGEKWVPLSTSTAGEVNTASNLSGGTGIFGSKSESDLQFKSIIAGTNVSIADDSNTITISSTDTGEVNTASNLGSGEGVFGSKSGSDLRFKSIVAGTNVALVSDGNTITISSTDTGEVNTASNLGGGEGVFGSKVGSDLQLKSIVAGTKVALVSDSDTITINVDVDEAVGYVTSTGASGLITIDINTDDSKFDIHIDRVVIVDHSTPSAPFSEYGPITFTGLTSPLMATEAVSYIGVDASGDLVYSSVRFTDNQRRSIAVIGVVVHLNNANISTALAEPVLTTDNDSLLFDFVGAVAPINIGGNTIGPFDNTLAITRSSGEVFGRSINYEQNPSAPNYKSILEDTNATFFSNYRDATDGVVIGTSSLIDNTHYDDGSGTLATLSGKFVAVHRISFFPSDESLIILYGQEKYSDMNKAKQGYTSEVFEQRSPLLASIFLGWLFVEGGVTDMTDAFDTGEALFVAAGKFGASSGAGGGGFDPSEDQDITGNWEFSEYIDIAIPGSTPGTDDNGIRFLSFDEGAGESYYSFGVLPGTQDFEITFTNDDAGFSKSVMAFDVDGVATVREDLKLRKELWVNQTLRLVDSNGALTSTGAFNIERDVNKNTLFRKYSNDLTGDNVVAITIQASDGEVVLAKDPEQPLGAATKQYVDTGVGYVTSTGASGLITMDINTDVTKFDIHVNRVVIVDHSTPSAPFAEVGPITFTGLDSPFLATEHATYVGIDSLGAIVYNPAPFTDNQKRTVAAIGHVVHTDRISITEVVVEPSLTEDNGALLCDLISAIAPINLSGNAIIPFDNTLAITITAGTLFGRSINYAQNPDSPNYKDTLERANTSFFTNYRDATDGVVIGSSTLVDVDHFDDGSGTLANVGARDVVVHRVYIFPGIDQLSIVYGQVKYNSMIKARERFASEAFEDRGGFLTGLFVGWLFVEGGVTDMTDAFSKEEALFVASSTSGGSSGGGGLDPADDQAITGSWSFSQELIVVEPTTAFGAANKSYVDSGAFGNDSLSGYAANTDISLTAGATLTLTSGTSSSLFINSGGSVSISADTNEDIELLTSGTGRVSINLGPVAELDVVNKGYVDVIDNVEVSATTYTLASTDIGDNLIFTNVVGCVVTVPTGLVTGFNVTFTSETIGDVSVVDDGTSVITNIDSEFILEGENASCVLLPKLTPDSYNFIGRTKP